MLWKISDKWRVAEAKRITYMFHRVRSPRHVTRRLRRARGAETNSPAVTRWHAVTRWWIMSSQRSGSRICDGPERWHRATAISPKDNVCRAALRSTSVLIYSMHGTIFFVVLVLYIILFILPQGSHKTNKTIGAILRTCGPIKGIVLHTKICMVCRARGA